jgi:hypothetical protein
MLPNIAYGLGLTTTNLYFFLIFYMGVRLGLKTEGENIDLGYLSTKC